MNSLTSAELFFKSPLIADAGPRGKIKKPIAPAVRRAAIFQALLSPLSSSLLASLSLALSYDDGTLSRESREPGINQAYLVSLSHRSLLLLGITITSVSTNMNIFTQAENVRHDSRWIIRTQSWHNFIERPLRCYRCSLTKKHFPFPDNPRASETQIEKHLRVKT